MGTIKDKRRKRKACRGVAEIEALLCIFVLIGVLLVTFGMAKIGLARLNAIEDAMHKVMTNSQTGATPQYTQDGRLTEVTTEWDIRPGLPNRTHVATSEKTIKVFVGGDQTVGPFRPGGIAGAISPTWMMSAYPAKGGDSQATQKWFEDFVVESHVELAPPLMMQPSWRP
jgi:hypothetical protein